MSAQNANVAISRTTSLPFDEAVAATKEALKGQGFGVLTEIDVQATLREKLGVETDAYRILGACNPPLAHRAISAEPLIGVLLPCNVVVREAGDTVVIDAMDPAAVLPLVKAEGVEQIAGEVRQKLSAALDAIPG